MSIFKKISEFFSPTGPRKAPDYSSYITVRCNRCGEIIQARIDLRNDLSIDYGETASGNMYYCRKVLIGEQRCYQPIEVKLTYDSRHKLIERQITGGEFVDEA